MAIVSSRAPTPGPRQPTDEQVAVALQGANGLVSAYIFGSAAEGRTHRESDLDLAVLFDRRLYPAHQDRFEARLRPFLRRMRRIKLQALAR
jgi:predicted nucleotidyltransferase